jgi:phosphonate transport system permease protein
MTAVVAADAGSAAPPTKAVAAAEAAFRAARAEKRRVWLLGGGVFLAALLVSAEVGDFDLVKIANGVPRLGEFIYRTLPVIRAGHVLEDLGEWFFQLPVWLGLLAETMQIAVVATALGGGVALMACFPAARNMMPHPAIRFVLRRGLEVARTVPDLVWALILVFCLGAGPLAGALAIAIHAAGALGKLFSEVVEEADPGPMEGVRAAGGSWFALARLAIVPQVLPNFLSYGLLRFEINVRSSSIIGFVGAGGLGQELKTVIAMGLWTDLSALILLILGLVIVIDLACERLRHHVIGIIAEARQ